jgi:DNA-binding CsgD family transcriptional regulator/PAS domain-containing protein
MDNSEPSRSKGFPEANPNPVLSTGPDGVVKFINHATIQLLHDLELDSVEDILPFDHKRLVKSCLKASAPVTEERDADGRTIVWAYRPISDTDLIYIYGHDVSSYRSRIDSTRGIHILLAALDNLATPVLIIDDELRVSFRNRAARAFLDNTGNLHIKNGVLGSSISTVTRKLQALVSSSRQDEAALAIPRFTGEGLYEILLSPIQLDSSDDHHDASMFIAYLFDPQQPVGVFSDILTSLYRLTPAEIKLTERLVKGDNLQDAITELGIAMSTARTQLRSIFKKTGTPNQSALIRRIVMGPAGQLSANCQDKKIHALHPYG